MAKPAPKSRLVSRLPAMLSIKEQRDNRRYSQAKIAEETDLSPSTISRIMAGDIESASMVTVHTLLDWLDCNPGDLIGRELINEKDEKRVKAK